MAKIFVIHGHDHASLYKLKDRLRDWGLAPVVLMDEPNSGLTFIEKFERYGRQCDYAIAMLTPDDRQAAELPEEEKYRARQNVLLEMGWFMGKIGRRNVLC